MRAASIGPFAQRFLSGRGTARVSAAFARSVHLEAEHDALCIVDPTLGDGALNLVLSGSLARAPHLSEGAPARIDGGRIIIAEAVAIDARDAAPWSPPQSDLSAATPTTIDGFMREALARAPRDGAFRPAHDDASAARTPVERALRDRLRALRGWLARRDSRDRIAPAGGLVGLGSGLTPAGDDFIGGAMIALRLMKQTEAAGAIASSIAAIGGGATTILSGAMLRAAAEGVGGAALHALLDALARNDAAGAAARLDAIDRIGHTSGWDALAGAMAALRDSHH